MRFDAGAIVVPAAIPQGFRDSALDCAALLRDAERGQRTKRQRLLQIGQWHCRSSARQRTYQILCIDRWVHKNDVQPLFVEPLNPAAGRAFYATPARKRFVPWLIY